MAEPALKRKRLYLFQAKLLTVILVMAALSGADSGTRAGRRADSEIPGNSSSSSLQYRLTSEDEALIDDLSRREFLFFLEQASPDTGLVRDRARADGSEMEAGRRNIASIAATGFGLTALCIGESRGWISKSKARKRVLATLRFFARRASQEHGWFYHWMDAATGERVWNSEISSIDTALLLGGILTVRGYYRNDSTIRRLAGQIYDRIDFEWMLNGDPLLLSHGWKPESGFLRPRWDTYSEHTILYILGIGSRTHPIDPASWYAWKRPRMEYAGFRYITGGPLFIHQFSHAWIDYRNRIETKPPFDDFYSNSISATRAHRAFCTDLAAEFPGYSEDVWGITASDSARGYVAWGGPPRDSAIDGTVVPCAAAGSLMFTPDICLRAVHTMKTRYGDTVYRKYGFVDAFNPNTGWTDSDVIGIDLGISLLSAENLRTGSVWTWFMRNKEIVQALEKIGLNPKT